MADIYTDQWKYFVSYYKSDSTKVFNFLIMRWVIGSEYITQSYHHLKVVGVLLACWDLGVLGLETTYIDLSLGFRGWGWGFVVVVHSGYFCTVWIL